MKLTIEIDTDKYGEKPSDLAHVVGQHIAFCGFDRPCEVPIRDLDGKAIGTLAVEADTGKNPPRKVEEG